MGRRPWLRLGHAYDCKWGARGIDADVLHQLDDPRANAEAEGEDEALGVARLRV